MALIIASFNAEIRSISAVPHGARWLCCNLKPAIEPTRKAVECSPRPVLSGRPGTHAKRILPSVSQLVYKRMREQGIKKGGLNFRQSLPVVAMEGKMNVTKALTTVVGTAAGFGIAGTLIGMLLGKIAPGFFRQMLPLRDPGSFNPLELGIGLGLTNGLGWGVVVGVLLVAILAWKETRLVRKEAQEKANNSIGR